MKIIKNRLKQIIKEELEASREGGEFDGTDPVIDPSHDVFDKVMQMYRFLVGTQNVDPERAKKMIRDQTEFALSQADTHSMNKGIRR
jgi:hypothetical protein